MTPRRITYFLGGIPARSCYWGLSKIAIWSCMNFLTWNGEIGFTRFIESLHLLTAAQALVWKFGLNGCDVGIGRSEVGWYVLCYMFFEVMFKMFMFMLKMTWLWDINRTTSKHVFVNLFMLHSMYTWLHVLYSISPMPSSCCTWNCWDLVSLQVHQLQCEVPNLRGEGRFRTNRNDANSRQFAM